MAQAFCGSFTGKCEGGGQKKVLRLDSNRQLEIFEKQCASKYANRKRHFEISELAIKADWLDPLSSFHRPSFESQPKGTTYLSGF